MSLDSPAPHRSATDAWPACAHCLEAVAAARVETIAAVRLEVTPAACVMSLPPGQGGASSANAVCTRGHHDDSGSMTSKCPAPGNSSSAASSPAARARSR